MGPEFPSYGHWILEEDCTALFEAFQRKDESPNSKNHHFFGDISGWFYRELAGIKIDPYEESYMTAEISPQFLETLSFVRAEHRHPAGLIRSAWERQGDGIDLAIEVPAAMMCLIRLPEGWVFEDTRMNVRDANQGSYHLVRETIPA